MDNPSAGLDKKIHTSEGIQIDGLDGQIDILGGGWQNAVYKITIDENFKNTGPNSI